MINQGKKKRDLMPRLIRSGVIRCAAGGVVLVSIFFFVSFESLRSTGEVSVVLTRQDLEEEDEQDAIRDRIGDNTALIKLTTENGKVRMRFVSKNESAEFVLSLSEDDFEMRTKGLESILQSRFLLPGEPIENYQRRTKDLDAAYWHEARLLSNQIIGPVERWIEGKRIVIDADGSLQQINFAALPRPNSSPDEPIILSNEVVYHRHFLDSDVPDTDGAKSAKKTILVVADPIFSFEDERMRGVGVASHTDVRSTTNAMIPRLPETKEEANSIETLVGPRNATVLTGLGANRDAVLNSNLSNYDALHFATHGSVDPDDPRNSGLLLSVFDGHEGSAVDTSIRVSDIASLHLDTELVVLSGCETGKGKVIGKDMVSLKTAFIAAGARSVVSSLWKVDDTATKQLMTHFYQAIATEGLTASAALRKAQIAMYKDPRYASPFHWAAFTAQGDYQRVADIQGPFPLWVFSLLIVPIGLFILRWYRRARRTS